MDLTADELFIAFACTAQATCDGEWREDPTYYREWVEARTALCQRFGRELDRSRESGRLEEAAKTGASDATLAEMVEEL